ncbi:MAG: hypothetical protein JO255_00890 [Alphaproteobacteria bacterium]|nr:hypothetical protein [Alphaproteobacteria bacterium]
MIGISISPEQLATAPAEVRHWLEKEIAATFAMVARAQHDVDPSAATRIAACRPEEAARIFELIKGDYVTCEVFFELGRELGAAAPGQPLYGIRLGDLARHARLDDSGRLVACREAINAAFRTVRQDEQATMLGFDQLGHLFIHTATHQSIQMLWTQLMASEPNGRAPEAPAAKAGVAA